nr:unnamed protein product [Callosobruchus analis]
MKEKGTKILNKRNEGSNDQLPLINEGDEVFIKTTGRNKIRKKYTKLKVDKSKDSYRKIEAQINKDDIVGHALLLDLGHTQSKLSIVHTDEEICVSLKFLFFRNCHSICIIYTTAKF